MINKKNVYFNEFYWWFNLLRGLPHTLYKEKYTKSIILREYYLAACHTKRQSFSDVSALEKVKLQCKLRKKNYRQVST
jgi:hypothetical protein